MSKVKIVGYVFLVLSVLGFLMGGLYGSETYGFSVIVVWPLATLLLIIGLILLIIGWVKESHSSQQTPEQQ